MMLCTDELLHGDLVEMYIFFLQFGNQELVSFSEIGFNGIAMGAGSVVGFLVKIIIILMQKEGRYFVEVIVDPRPSSQELRQIISVVAFDSFLLAYFKIELIET